MGKEGLLDIIRKDFEEFEKSNKIQAAKELSKSTGIKFSSEEYPHYFFGNLESEVVLVHYNGKKTPESKEKKHFNNFADYINYFKNYGLNKYKNTNIGLNDLDKKQMYFLRPFRVIDFTYNNEREDVIRALDNKLQLELIPYSSEGMSSKDFKNKIVLKPYIENILQEIAVKDRRLVIFCGSIFKEVLKPYISECKDYKIKVIKNDGKLVKNNLHYETIYLKYNKKVIKAGIADSFKINWLNTNQMEQYSEECKKYYNEF